MLHSWVGSGMYWTRTGLGRTCVFAQLHIWTRTGLGRTCVFAQLHICTMAWIFATFGKFSVPFFFLLSSGRFRRGVTILGLGYLYRVNVAQM